MNGLQSSRAESFSQSWDHDMTEKSSYANPTRWGDNKSDRCTTLFSAHFTKKDWPTQTKLTSISFSPATGVSQFHQAWLDYKSNWEAFLQTSGSQCTVQFPICEAEQHSDQSSNSPHVTATLLWGVWDNSTGKCPLALCGETASSTCQGTWKEEWCSLKHIWVGFFKAVAWVWAPPPQECTAWSSVSSTAGHGRGRGKHRIHKCRLVKVIILHYLLLGPELSGTPLTVCCAPHTAPIHSAVPRFAC